MWILLLGFCVDYGERSKCGSRIEPKFFATEEACKPQIDRSVDTMYSYVSATKGKLTWYNCDCYKIGLET